MSRIVYAACLALVLLPAAASTQTLRRPAGPDEARLNEWRPDESLGRQSATASQSPSPRRDSLWNGALAGAAIGALVGAAGGHAALDCSACAGFNVPLTFGVIGAGGGAAIGAWIDALRHARPSVRTPVDPARRIVVAPVVGPRTKGVTAAVTF